MMPTLGERGLLQQPISDTSATVQLEQFRQQAVGELEIEIGQALLDQFKLRGSPITFKDTLKL